MLSFLNIVILLIVCSSLFIVKISKHKNYFKNLMIFTPLKKRYHILQTQLTDIFKEMAVFIYYFYQWLINKIKAFRFVGLISFKIMYYFIGRNKSKRFAISSTIQAVLLISDEWVPKLPTVHSIHAHWNACFSYAYCETEKKKKKRQQSCRCGKLRSFAKEAQNLGCAEQL